MPGTRRGSLSHTLKEAVRRNQQAEAQARKEARRRQRRTIRDALTDAPAGLVRSERRYGHRLEGAWAGLGERPGR
jgi:hypothetical protein